MRSMGSPKLGDGGQVLDPGTDLNMEGGLAEHAKVSSCAIVERRVGARVGPTG